MKTGARRKLVRKLAQAAGSTRARRGDPQYESYVVRIYRRNGRRLSGVIEVVATGATHRFTGSADLLAIIAAPSVSDS